MADSTDAGLAMGSSSASGSSKSGWRGSNGGKAVSSAGKALSDYGRQETENARSIGDSIRPVAYKRGGKVKSKKRTKKPRSKAR